MVYKSKFVAAVKVGGKVLREANETVTLPFGSEYSLLLKNLNSVRVLVNVSIDGDDISGGNGIILSPNSRVDLERYIRNGNFDRGNRFKFIERTQAVENHRGAKVDDGLIRIEYKTEKVERVEHVSVRRHYYDDYPWYPVYPRPYTPRPWSPYYPPVIWSSTNEYTNGFQTSNLVGSAQTQNNVGHASASSALRSSGFQGAAKRGRNFSDVGITVPGSESQQKFVAGSSFPTLEHSDVIVIHLRGVAAGRNVERPVLVSKKLSCPTCGKQTKSNFQFCGKCGTSLTVI